MGRLVSLSLMALLLGGAFARAEDRPITIEATLILASNDPSALDRRLDQISYQLRRIFKFEYFKYLGGGQASVRLPSDFTIQLGQGHELQANASRKDGKTRVHVNWLRNGESVLNTAVGIKAGAHAILGGIPHENGTLIVTLTAR